MRSRLNDDPRGQDLIEYALILVLVAVVVIAGLVILGPTVGNVFSTINSSLSLGGPQLATGASCWVSNAGACASGACMPVEGSPGAGVCN